MNPSIKKLVAVAFTIVGLTSASSAAHAAVIGFEGIAPAGGAVFSPTPHSESGFTLTSSPPDAGIDGIFSVSHSSNDNGTDIFGWCGICIAEGQPVFTLSHDGGALFSFLSLEGSNLDPGDFNSGMSIDVTGYLGAGGTVTQSFALIADTFTTFILAASFTGLSSVEILGSPFPTINFAHFAMDNLTVTVDGATPVSEPGTLAILGISLVGLGFIRRRRNA